MHQLLPLSAAIVPLSETELLVALALAARVTQLQVCFAVMSWQSKVLRAATRLLNGTQHPPAGSIPQTAKAVPGPKNYGGMPKHAKLPTARLD